MRRAGLAAGLVAIALAALPPAAAAHEGHAPPPGAGVRSRYAFPLPAPGSYGLPPIKAAGDGRVLDEDGREQALRQLLLGRATVLAFIYTRCGDLCPAASLDMSQLQDLAAKDKRVAGRMRLVTMSFDPEHARRRRCATTRRSSARPPPPLPNGCSSPRPTAPRWRRCSPPITRRSTRRPTRHRRAGR